MSNTNTNIWTIESCAGQVFGDYPGATPKDALMAMFAETGDDYGSDIAGTEDDWLIYPPKGEDNGE